MLTNPAEDDSVVEITYTADESGRMRPDTEDDEGCIAKTSRCDCCNEKLLDAVTGIVIFVNVVLMGIELDVPWSGYTYIEQAMLCVYIMDVVLRMWWNGFKKYFVDKLHLIDITIVLASTFEIWFLPMFMAFEESEHTSGTRKRGSLLTNMTMALRAFRLVRAIRLIKLVKFARPLYLILSSLSAAFVRVCWVMVLIGVSLYAFSLVFTQLLGRDMLDTLGDDPKLAILRQRFSTVPRTFFELFRAMCGDVTDFGMIVSAEDNIVVPLAYYGLPGDDALVNLSNFYCRSCGHHHYHQHKYGQRRYRYEGLAYQNGSARETDESVKRAFL
jgi:hypothetical protein